MLFQPVKLLLKASSVAIGEDNNTPSHIAASNGHTGMVWLLRKKGTETRVTGENIDTLLHHAAKNGHAGKATPRERCSD